MAQRVLACTGCHGPEGRAAADGYYPRIAGKPAGLPAQPAAELPRRPARLCADGEPARAARRRLPARDRRPTSPASTCPIRRRAPLTLSPTDLAAAARLVAEGDPARSLPACTACHGKAMTGTAPFVPGLVGLPRDYLNAQLGAWRNGKRVAQAPDCMAAIAKQARARGDRPDLGLARRPAGAGRREAGRPAFAAPMPMACGGVPASRRGRNAAMSLRRVLGIAGLAALGALVALAGVVAWLNLLGEERLGPTPPRARRRAPSCWRAAKRSPAPATAPAATPRAAARFLRRRPGDRDAVRQRLCVEPHPRPGHRPRQLVGRRVLARPAPRPLEERAAALSGVSVSELHPRVASRCRRDVRLPAEPAGGGAAEPRAHARLSVRHAGGARRLARALLPPGGPCRRSGPLGRMESRRLPGRGPGPLQRLPLGAQRARRDPRHARPARRPDPGAELVRAFAGVAARSERRRLAEARGRAAAQDRRRTRRASSWGR